MKVKHIQTKLFESNESQTHSNKANWIKWKSDVDQEGNSFEEPIILVLRPIGFELGVKNQEWLTCAAIEEEVKDQLGSDDGSGGDAPIWVPRASSLAPAWVQLHGGGARVDDGGAWGGGSAAVRKERFS